MLTTIASSARSPLARQIVPRLCLSRYAAQTSRVISVFDRQPTARPRMEATIEVDGVTTLRIEELRNSS
jgi:hypothetical protein